MLETNFNPWGECNWLLKGLSTDVWDLLGSVSAEDRCVGLLKNLSETKVIGQSLFLDIIDPPSEFTNLIKTKVDKNKAIIARMTDNPEFIQTDLLASSHAIVSIWEAYLENSSGNLILDITSIPKRFFFPFVKLAIRDSKIKNLLISYTSAKSYSKEDLASDPEIWNNLPLFGQQGFKPVIDVAMIGVGFLPFSLPELLRDGYTGNDITVNFMFPFPPGPPNVSRTWEFMRKIEDQYKLNSQDKIKRISSVDVSQAFSQIKALTSNGKKKAIFAPYGPKPLSLAMCIYSTLTNSVVYYNQPRIYNPNYSSGINQTALYSIKLNSEVIYKV